MLLHLALPVCQLTVWLSSEQGSKLRSKCLRHVPQIPPSHFIGAIRLATEALHERPGRSAMRDFMGACQSMAGACFHRAVFFNCVIHAAVGWDFGTQAFGDLKGSGTRRHRRALGLKGLRRVCTRAQALTAISFQEEEHAGVDLNK